MSGSTAERTGDIEASIDFVVDTGATPVARSTGPTGRIAHEGRFESKAVTIRDARDRSTALDTEGFMLRVHDPRTDDLTDELALREAYYPAAETLIGDAIGAQRVHVFDHTLRSGDVSEQERHGRREPLGVAHNDYSVASGPRRLRRALPDEADALLERRFAIVQVWRPIAEPVDARPLAICDATSVRPIDLIATERRHSEYVGEIYTLVHHSDQRWWYYPSMTRGEALIFKVYDSDPDRARWTPHASFVDPRTSSNAPPRRSIEIRALAFF